MQHLEVVIEGVCLWIDRGTWWDVLFPKADASSDQHIPLLTGEVADVTIIPGCSLVEQTLDLVHLAPGASTRPPLHWMLPVDAPAHRAPAHALDVAQSTDIVASVRLPKARLAPVRVFQVGPVHYGSNPPQDLDYGTRWSSPIESGSGRAIFRDRKSQAAIGEELLNAPGRLITLRIRNRTKREHATKKNPNPTKKGDRLREVGDVHRLVELPAEEEDLPQYNGDDLDGSTLNPVSLDLREIRVDPEKLCPHCYLL